MTKALVVEPDTDHQLQELAEREARIERALRNAFYEIGLDLRAIRDSKLYRVERPHRVKGRYSFETFEEYCEKRWELTLRRSHQIIETAEAVDKIGKIFPVLPARESHVRALLDKLETDAERLDVWQQIIADGPDQITARLVEDHCTRYIAARDKEFHTLAEWSTLSDEDRRTALTFDDRQHKLNGQDGSEERNTQGIEWAQWSWNPVTGCRHNCPYCYARDIAHRFYPASVGFEPAFWHKRLTAPTHTPVPAKAAGDISFRNVFTCSMADLFGRWVPREWIEAVLAEVRQNPQWNFLFLTKFALRLTEFEFPENAWVGTTVDCQARVKAAEDAFARVQASVKWLSIEPMLEPLQFAHLDRFQWMVLGGASRSSQTPEWHVPVEWWAPLYQTAVQAGLTVYLKSNLYERVRGYPGSPAPTPETPKALLYLTSKSKDDLLRGER